jgi:hypothetical protein
MGKMLNTVDGVIDALGGTGAVAKLTKRRDSAVSNWRTVGTIPPKTFLQITTALELIGHTVSPKVFGMAEFKAPVSKYSETV